MGDQLFRLIAGMNTHFACNDQLPADCDAWHQLRRHVVRMNTALVLVYVNATRGARDWHTAYARDRAQARGVGALGGRRH